jgi:thiol-disulfide isomerase/thioredoxin
MPSLSRKTRVWLLLLGIAAFSWITHSAYRSLSQQQAQTASAPLEVLKPGMTMPSDLRLESLGGKTSELNEFSGKVVLINFWAGWCTPCLHEMPALYELQRQFASRGFVVLGLNMDEDPQLGLRVLKKVAGEAPFSMYRGLSSAIADRFALEGLPFTVVLDRSMKIQFAKAGEINWKDAEAVQMIQGLL